MFGMDKVGILSVHMEDVFEHAEDEGGYCKDLRERTEADFLGNGNE